MTERLRLFGTEAADLAAERISLGNLSFSLQDGALRHIRLGDTELIRGIAFLVRDRDWGTLAPELTEVARRIDNDRLELVLNALYLNGDATLDVSLHISADADSLSVRAKGLASQPFETNRAGFTVLHPAALAGQPVSVVHSDAAVEASAFPTLIEPWQPFKDISALEHSSDGLRIHCAFEGDCFESEDQRQWGDASYKTYVRPLALPWPYELTAEQPLEQSVTVSWSKAAQMPAYDREKIVRAFLYPTAPQLATKKAAKGLKFPETALVLDAADARRLAANTGDVAAVSPQRLLCHVDVSQGDAEAQIAAFAQLQSAQPLLIYDAELICGFQLEPLDELTQLREFMHKYGYRPDSVLVCPAVDRQSTPPGSEWPSCPPLEAVHQASAAVFSDLQRGGGMVSFFPELNRKRPPLALLNFVSHGLCPTVHAADDLSVMETLETIPHISRSARAIMGKREYRIGPATIAMRQNPYGQRTMPNPDQLRLCMADDDPRHRAQFGAAYAMGLATALAPAGVSVWTPAALYGPRGLSGPIVAAIAALSACAGQRVHAASISAGLARLHIGDTLFEANLSERPLGALGPYEWRQTVHLS